MDATIGGGRSGRRCASRNLRYSSSDTENRAKEKLQGVVLPEQLIAFQTQLIQILRSTIEDKVVLNEVATKMRTLAGMDQPALPAKTIDVEVVEVQG